MKRIFTAKCLLPLFAAMALLGQVPQARADLPDDDDLYFPGDYDFTMDMTSLSPQSSIYSSQYWSNIAGLPPPAMIAVTPTGSVQAFWTNGSSITISGGDRIPNDPTPQIWTPDEDGFIHWGTTGVRG